MGRWNEAISHRRQKFLYVKLFTKSSCELWKKKKLFKTPTNFNFNSNRNFSSLRRRRRQLKLYFDTQRNIGDMMMMVSCYSSGDSVDVVGFPLAAAAYWLASAVRGCEQHNMKRMVSVLVPLRRGEKKKKSVSRQNESAHKISMRVLSVFGAFLCCRLGCWSLSSI